MSASKTKARRCLSHAGHDSRWCWCRHRRRDKDRAWHRARTAAGTRAEPVAVRIASSSRRRSARGGRPVWNDPRFPLWSVSSLSESGDRTRTSSRTLCDNPLASRGSSSPQSLFWMSNLNASFPPCLSHSQRGSPGLLSLNHPLLDRPCSKVEQCPSWYASGCDQTNRGQDALVEQAIERRSGDAEELHRLVKRDEPLSNKLVVSHSDHLPVV